MSLVLLFTSLSLGGATGPLKASLVCGVWWAVLVHEKLMVFSTGRVHPAGISPVRARTETSIHHVRYKYAALWTSKQSLTRVREFNQMQQYSSISLPQCLVSDNREIVNYNLGIWITNHSLFVLGEVYENRPCQFSHKRSFCFCHAQSVFIDSVVLSVEEDFVVFSCEECMSASVKTQGRVCLSIRCGRVCMNAS